MIIINESGLYSLIISSKLPNAKKFKRWVTSEVLPSIRKTGEYKTSSGGKGILVPAEIPLFLAAFGLDKSFCPSRKFRQGDCER